MPSRPALLSLALFALAGCAPPLSQGGVIVLPGATERLILAMRMGYVGMGDAKPPAAVRRVAVDEDGLGGAAATGRPGDVRLENQSMAAIVAQIGGPHGGMLVDLAKKGGGHTDELGAVDTIVAGAKVRYETLKIGTDDATRAAFVLVTGHPAGHPEIVVSTRYDVAPELDAVLVHTSLVVANELAGPLAVGDEMSFESRPTWQSTAGYAAAFEGTGGYALKPLVDVESARPTAATSGARAATIGLAPSAVSTGTFVYSRMVAALERPDSLALAAALAAGDGDELGEIDIEVIPSLVHRPLPGGVFVLADATDPQKRLELTRADAIHLGDRIDAKVPAGAYRLSFEAAGYRSPGSTSVNVVRKQLASTKLVVTPVTLASPPSSPPSTSAASPETSAPPTASSAAADDAP